MGKKGTGSIRKYIQELSKQCIVPRMPSHYEILPYITIYNVAIFLQVNLWKKGNKMFLNSSMFVFLLIDNGDFDLKDALDPSKYIRK